MEIICMGEGDEYWLERFNYPFKSFDGVLAWSVAKVKHEVDHLYKLDRVNGPKPKTLAD